MSEPIYTGTLTGEDYISIQEHHIHDLESEIVDSEVEIYISDEEPEIEIHARYPDSGTSRTDFYSENDIEASLDDFRETLEILNGSASEETGSRKSLLRISKYF